MLSGLKYGIAERPLTQTQLIDGTRRESANLDIHLVAKPLLVLRDPFRIWVSIEFVL